MSAMKKADGADLILGPPLDGRTCGGCTLCCFLPEINTPELQKPAAQLCRNCTGGGCSIYDHRPEICRDWHCAWRRVGAMPEAARPDLIGVMFELAQPAAPRSILHKLYVRGIAVGSWKDFEHPDATRAIAHFRTLTLPLWLCFGDRMTLAHPAPEIAHCLLGPAPAPTEAIAQEVQRWRTIFEPL